MIRRRPAAKPRAPRSQRLAAIYFMLAIPARGLAGCASGPEISATWQRPNYQARVFDKIAVVALSGRALMRRTIENHIVAELQEHGLHAAAGMDLVPEELWSAEQQGALRERFAEQGVDAVMALRAVDRRVTEHREPALSFDPTRDFYYEYGIFFEPVGRAATVDAERTVVAQCALYDLRSSGPIAVRVIDVTDASNIQQIRDGAKLLVDSFRSAGLLPSR